MSHDGWTVIVQNIISLLYLDFACGNVEICMHSNLAFSQCSNSIYQAFDGQTEFSRVYNFTILSHL